MARLRGSVCRVKPAPVYLVAGQTRSFTGGPAADWAVELVAGPKGATRSDIEPKLRKG